MISFIVSSYERPLKLLTCVTSILAQENQEVEIIIVDNSNIQENVDTIKQFSSLRPDQIECIHTAGLVSEEVRQGSYDASVLLGVPLAKGDWLCFPNDDSYYVPGFADTILNSAKSYDWDFIYCNMVYDPRWNGNTYEVVQGCIRPRYISKSSFVIRRELFNGFPPHEQDWRDYALAKEINDRGIKHGCAPGVLHVSN